jgi:PIN domain nuclease of toxin-antitoxin system
MDLDLDEEGAPVHATPHAEAALILLDTNALIWLWQAHPRARRLGSTGRLFASPASILELQILAESGRLHLRNDVTAAAALADERWVIDDAPSARWFTAATEIGWTHDPFDRLIVAHARIRGWKVATSDEPMLDHLSPAERVAL